MKKQYLDYAGLKRVLKRLLPGARKIWHGTEAEWEALSETERDKYDQAEVINDINNPKANLNPRPDWANAVAISALPFTAPEDGTLVLTIGATSAYGNRIFYIDGIEVGKFASTNIGHISTLTFPICKGQVLTSDSGVWGSYKFVPWKGPYVE